MLSDKTIKELNSEVAALHSQVAELQDTLRAISTGEVDAVLLTGEDGPEVFTRKGAEHAYRVMVEAKNEGAAILVDGKIIYSNSYLARMLNTPLEQVIGQPLLNFVPRDAHESIKAILADGLKESSRHEVLFCDAEGTNLPLQISLNVLDIQGQQGLCMVATNLSERVLKQLQLAASVYQSSSEAMAVTDENNIILSVNPAFTTITGYRADEVLGKTPNLLSSGRHDKAFYSEMWDAINSTGHWAGEIWNRKKNGDIYAEWLNINVIHDKSGASHRHVALFSEITDRKKSEETIWRHANFDTLTQLPNRRLFSDRMEQGVKHAFRSKDSMALLLIDLDGFKEVNDSFGHQVGDELLVEAAQRIKSCVRETDTVARLGGDEFTVILTKITDLNHIERVAQSLIAVLSRPYQLGKERVIISASIGISVCPADAGDAMTMLKNADQAMYKSKEDGKNRFSHFSKAIEEKSIRRLQLIKDLHEALPKGEFELYYQPVIDFRTGRITKAEALLRWHHPVRGMVSPMEFIPVAEETGLIIEIGDWVFHEVQNIRQRWLELAGYPVWISINVSPVQLMSKERIDLWIKSIQDREIAGEGIIVEITEGVLLKDRVAVSKALLDFRDNGIEVAIDDFGTGYSSLSYLSQFDIDYLKIDQSFTRNLAPDSSELVLSKAIIVMAHELGMKVIAEGIETKAQRDMLVAAGCDFGQGYLFSRPLPIGEFEEMLSRVDEFRVG
jgi:diguanylate cyclase (GGDEF)-like protein/PAS domain S-box-containing protein